MPRRSPLRRHCSRRDFASNIRVLRGPKACIIGFEVHARRRDICLPQNYGTRVFESAHGRSICLSNLVSQLGTPHAVGMPATSKASLIVTGTPHSGWCDELDTSARIAWSATSSLLFGGGEGVAHHSVNRRIDLFDPINTCPHDFLRRYLSTTNHTG